MPTQTDMSYVPAYALIADWCILSGMSRTGTYQELSRGNLRAVKRGKRVLIDVRHGLAWMGSLPPVNIKLTGFSPNKKAA